MSGLQLAVFDAPNGLLLADWTSRARALDWQTGEHGPRSLSATIRMSADEQFAWFERAGVPHVEINVQGMTLWAGRMEDVALGLDGLAVTVLGYWQALSDVPQTALWSSVDVTDWRIAASNTVVPVNDKLFDLDANERLYISLVKDTVYATGVYAEQYLMTPSGNTRKVTHATADYALNLPTQCRARIMGYDAGFTNAVTLMNIVGTDVLVTGSFISAPFSRDFIAVHLRVATGITFAGESGTKFFQVTNIRVRTADIVDVDDIATALLADTRAVNPTQLDSLTTLIGSPNRDLLDEVYEDALPADILTRLTALGGVAGGVTDGTRWEVGVDAMRRLYLRLRGSAGRTWYTDLDDLIIERSLSTVVNSAYAVYEDVSGGAIRESAVADASSVARYGLTRRRPVPVRSTSATQAAIERNATLASFADPVPRAAVTVTRLYDAFGGRWPLWMAHSGDVLVLRNLSPHLGTTVDRVRSFALAETTYNAIDDTLETRPESPLPAIDVLLARQQERL